MKIKALTAPELVDRLNGQGLCLASGPFSLLIKSSLHSVAEGISVLYGEFELLNHEDFFDFHVRVDAPLNIRRWFHKQVVFTIDDFRPFKPLPQAHALPVLEWGLNWCIANHAHQYLMLHSAVVEKKGTTVLLPGHPGSGKSTLCAGLVGKGWRLLSDEMALVDLAKRGVAPNPRPISLKNNSIEVIRSFCPKAVIGPLAHGTDKGTVAHVAPPKESVERQNEMAPLPSKIIFPKYMAGSDSSLVDVSKASAIMQLIESTFNYNALGAQGFNLLADILDECECQRFTYSSLDEAVELFDGFLGE